MRTLVLLACLLAGCTEPLVGGDADVTVQIGTDAAPDRDCPLTDEGRIPSLSFTRSESNDRINVVSADNQVAWNCVDAHFDVAGTISLNGQATTNVPAGVPTPVGTGTVNAGNYLAICGSHHVVMKYRGEQVFDTTFATLAC